MSKGIEKEWLVEILVVPSKLETMLGVAKVKTEKRVIKGATREDALKKAGIK